MFEFNCISWFYKLVVFSLNTIFRAHSYPSFHSEVPTRHAQHSVVGIRHEGFSPVECFLCLGLHFSCLVLESWTKLEPWPFNCTGLRKWGSGKKIHILWWFHTSLGFWFRKWHEFSPKTSSLGEIVSHTLIIEWFKAASLCEIMTNFPHKYILWKQSFLTNLLELFTNKVMLYLLN